MRYVLHQRPAYSTNWIEHKRTMCSCKAPPLKRRSFLKMKCYCSSLLAHTSENILKKLFSSMKVCRINTRLGKIILKKFKMNLNHVMSFKHHPISAHIDEDTNSCCTLFLHYFWSKYEALNEIKITCEQIIFWLWTKKAAILV